MLERSETTGDREADDDRSFYRWFILGFAVVIIMGLARTFELSYAVTLAIGATSGLVLSLIEHLARR